MKERKKTNKWHLIPFIGLVIFSHILLFNCKGEEPRIPRIPVAALELTPAEITIPVGGIGFIGSVITPANATNTVFSWRTDNSSVVAVDGDMITGLSIGTATITATTDFGDVSSTAIVNVVARDGYIPVERIVLNARTLTLNLNSEIEDGHIRPLYAMVYPEDATEQAVTFRSTNPDVATVDINGVVTGHADGNSTIIARTVNNGRTAQVSVFVQGGIVRPSTVKMTKPWDPSDPFDPAGRKQIRMYMTVWYEPEEDPRQVIGYELEDSTPFFDSVVMLYGLRLRYRDCLNREGINCNSQGLHACWGDNNMNHYLNNHLTYFAPIQARGINVLLSIVPANDGVGVSNLFNSTSWTPELETRFGPYPFRDEVAFDMIDLLADLLNTHGIDGIGYDEEYIGTWIPPDESPNVRFEGNGANILRFMHELNMAAGRRLIHESYEFGPVIPASATFKDRTTGEMITVYRDDLLDWSYAVTYGGWSMSRFGTPNHRYGPASIAIADTQNSPRPPIGEHGGAGIQARMKNVLHGGFGVVMFYCLRDRNQLVHGIPEWGLPRFPTGMFGPGNDGRPEAYFSQMTQILFGQNTVFRGRDFPRRFQFQ